MEYKEIEYRGTKVKVSPYGDVIWNGKRRNVYYNADGYSVCSIKVPNKGWVTARVARLVAIAYIPNPDNLQEVNHKDYDRTNSNVDNLEWVTRQQNIDYSRCNMPDYHGKNNPNYHNDTLHKKYQQDKELAKIKQSRKGLQNGRCRKIKIIENGQVTNEFDYIVECCKYLINRFNSTASISGIRSQIDKAIRNNGFYRGLQFVKE